MPPASRPAPSLREFIAIVALIMALISLSIDNLLPAFVPIRQALGVANANDMQLIVTVYMIGSGALQIVYGTVSDVIGRRPTLMIGIAVYSLGALIGAVAQSYEVLLLGRLVQGMGAAAAQVLAVALVRDRYEGREMARVLSLVFMVFIMVPVVAPALGSLTIALAGWRAVFASMLVMAVVVAVWFGLRMPETLSPDHRRPFSFRQIGAGIQATLNHRGTVGYGIAIALMMGCLMTYVSSSQQIFETEVYALGPLFPVAFGSIAGVMGLAFFANSTLVRSFGMHRLSHICLLAFVLLAIAGYAAALLYAGRPPLMLFACLLGGIQFLMCLTMPNFNAIAMEPLGAVAGTASAVLGLVTTLGGALIGMVVGRAFDGTVLPLELTYLLSAVAALIAVLWAERGTLTLTGTR
jgi:DHA1 family bicyclomycin/chloramphenicol resistance-like MFS transporter